MTTCHPGRSGGDAVKGLAKYGNRLHHGLLAKCVDTSPSLRRKGGYSPMSDDMLTGIVRISPQLHAKSCRYFHHQQEAGSRQ